MFLQHWRVLAPSSALCFHIECLVRFHLFVFVYLPRHLSIEIHILHHNNSMHIPTRQRCCCCCCCCYYSITVALCSKHWAKKLKKKRTSESSKKMFWDAICIGDMEMKAWHQHQYRYTLACGVRYWRVWVGKLNCFVFITHQLAPSWLEAVCDAAAPMSPKNMMMNKFSNGVNSKCRCS